jgi:hypothetical protein
MKRYEIKAEFVDATTGERHFPAQRGGEPALFAPRDDDQRDRLIAAGCLSSEALPSLERKNVAEMTRIELEEAAIEVACASLVQASDDDLRGAIQAYRDSLPQLDHDQDGKAGGAKAPQGDAATAAEINAALALLDPANDAHWTQAGLPSVDAVAELVDGKTVTRKAIEEANSSAKRPAAEDKA